MSLKLFIFLILNLFFLVFGSLNSLNETPTDLLEFAQVPPIVPQNSQKSPNLQKLSNFKSNIENPKINEFSASNKRQFVPLLVNGQRLVNIQPSNTRFVRIVSNNLSKFDEFPNEKDQRKNIQDGKKLKDNVSEKREVNLTPLTSFGRESLKFENKQLEEKNFEEKKNKFVNLNNKPLIFENSSNKIEEEKKLQSFDPLNNREKENRENNKKEESKNNNKSKETTTENNKNNENIPENLNERKNGNNKNIKEESNKNNAASKENVQESFPEKHISIYKSEKREENEERAKEKVEKDIKVIEKLANKNPFEYETYNKGENNFPPLTEWSFLPILLQSVFEEFKVASLKELNNQRNKNSNIKLNLKRNNKNIFTENESKNNEENNTKCKDLADNCKENLLFCGLSNYQELLQENCACSCKNYLNNKKGENEENKIEQNERESSEEESEESDEEEEENEKEFEGKKEEKKKNECSDKSFRCQQWAQRGFCKSKIFQLDLKKRFCANSCNLC